MTAVSSMTPTDTTTEPKKDSVTTALDLSAQLNPLYLENFKTAMNAVAPGASDILGKQITSLLSGELPDDVTKMIEQSAAEMNISQGRYGEAAGNRTMRDIGKTSLDAMSMGMSALKEFTPKLPDLTDLINSQRAYDVEQTKIDISQSEFASQLAEQQKEWADKTAMQKLQYDLQVKQQDEETKLAESKLELQKQSQQTASDQWTQEFNWEKEQTDWNKKYEEWSTSESQKLASQLKQKGATTKAANQSVADQTSDTILTTMKKWLKQNPSTSGNTWNGLTPDQLKQILDAMPKENSTTTTSSTTPNPADLTDMITGTLKNGNDIWNIINDDITLEGE